MNVVVQNTAAGIIVAALSGLTVTAYRNPEAYMKLFYGAMAIIFCAQIGIAVWDISAGVTYSTVFSVLSDTDKKKAIEAYNGVQLEFNPYGFIVIGLGLYLVFLVFLPSILKSGRASNR